MNFCKECSANERDLINDEEGNILPRVLQLPQCKTVDLCLPQRIGEYLKRRAHCSCTEANVEGRNSSVSSELHCGCYLVFLERQPDMLHASLQRRRLATASGTS